MSLQLVNWGILTMSKYFINPKLKEIIIGDLDLVNSTFKYV